MVAAADARVALTMCHVPGPLSLPTTAVALEYLTAMRPNP